MIVRVEDWDGVPSIRLPQEIIDKRSLKDCSELEVELKLQNLILGRPQQPKYTLTELLDRVTPENIHGEWDIGPPVGREILEPYDP